MPPLNIAIQLASLRLPLRRALVAAAQAGAKAVEIDARQGLGSLPLVGCRQERDGQKGGEEDGADSGPADPQLLHRVDHWHHITGPDRPAHG